MLAWDYPESAAEFTAPFAVEARLRFRSFPPFLVSAFIDYERQQVSARRRPSGAQVTPEMMRRIEIVDLAAATARVP